MFVRKNAEFHELHVFVVDPVALSAQRVNSNDGITAQLPQ